MYALAAAGTLYIVSAWLFYNSKYVCVTESSRQIASPSGKYQVEVDSSACNADSTSAIEVLLLRSDDEKSNSSGNEAEVLWKSRNSGDRKALSNQISVQVTWLDDVTVKLSIPKGSRGTLMPEFDNIKVIYEEH